MISPYVFVGLTSTKSKPAEPLDVFTRLLRHISIELFIDDPQKVLSAKRTRSHVECRQMISFILRKHYNISCKQVGLLLGNRDHSTIVHNTNMHKNDYKYCERYRNVFDRVCKYLL